MKFSNKKRYRRRRNTRKRGKLNKGGFFWPFKSTKKDESITNQNTPTEPSKPSRWSRMFGRNTTIKSPTPTSKFTSPPTYEPTDEPKEEPTYKTHDMDMLSSVVVENSLDSLENNIMTDILNDNAKAINYVKDIFTTKGLLLKFSNNLQRFKNISKIRWAAREV